MNYCFFVVVSVFFFVCKPEDVYEGAKYQLHLFNRIFATSDHVVQNRTGTLKQRDLNQWSLTCLCFDLPVRE